MTYILQIDADLFDEWGLLESWGYLPAMPGTLEDSRAWNAGMQRWEAHFTLTEAEADAFAEACEDLGEAFGSCIKPSLLCDLHDFLYEIAL